MYCRLLGERGWSRSQQSLGTGGVDRGHFISLYLRVTYRDKQPLTLKVMVMATLNCLMDLFFAVWDEQKVSHVKFCFGCAVGPNYLVARVSGQVVHIEKQKQQKKKKKKGQSLMQNMN